MPTRRDPWLDNAKMVLVTVVVIGHTLLLMPASELRAHVYDFLYYFHIPAFVLVSGYLSRSFRWTRRHLLSLVTMLLVPYVVYSWLMATFRVDVLGEVDELDPFLTDPRWPMWYLIVLLMWRLATPVLRLHPVMVPATIAVSLVAGRFDLELFDLNRALGLLPYFTLGLHLSEGVLRQVRSRWSPWAGVAVLAGIWWLAGHTDDVWTTEWLYFRSPYDALGVGPAEGAWLRLQLLAIGTLGSLAALALVPRHRHFITPMGAYTMVVYLLHGFVVKLAESAGLTDLLPGGGWLSLALLVTGSTALALLLAWPPMAQWLNYLVDPFGATAARRRPAPTYR